MPMVAAAAAAVVGAISTAVATVGAAAGAIAAGAASAVGVGVLGQLAIEGAVMALTPALLSIGALEVATVLTAPKVGQTAAGTQIDWQADPTAPVPYLIGRTGTSGSIVLKDVSGDNNKYELVTTVLSCAGPVKSVSGFTANDVAVSFTADGGEGAGAGSPTTSLSQAVPAGATVLPVASVQNFGGGQSITVGGETLTIDTVYSVGTEFSLKSATTQAHAVNTQVTGPGSTSFYQNRLWWKSSLGPQPGQHITFTNTGSKDTPANHSGIPSTWTASCLLSGLSHTIMSMEYDTAKYPAGEVKPLVVVEGVSAYDPRLDSTYPGGSGPQRAGDETTWAYSQNPYIHGLTWCIGRTANGRKTVGLHAPVAAIDVAAFVEGANVADSHGWTCGGVIYSTDGKRDVLRAILNAGSGQPIPLGAKISCLVDAPKVSLDTLTGADVIGDVAIAAIQSARAAPNTIWPRYREEAQGWNIVPTAAPIQVTAYFAHDGGQRSKEVEYTLCQSADQAATLARYDIENGREFGPITLPCKPRWMGYRPGDCITVNEPEYGLNNQKCLILSRTVDPSTFVCTLTLRSETDGKHAFALGETASPPAIPALTGIDIFNIPAPLEADWLAIGGELPGGDGTTAPVILVTGTPTNPNVSRALIDYRLPGSTVWSQAVPIDLQYDVAVQTQLTGLPAQAGFVVGVRYVSVRGIPGDRLELGTDASPIVTGDLTIQQEEQIVDGVHLAAATGGNALIDTDFQFVSAFWCQNYDETYSCGAAQRVLLNGKGALQRATSGTPAAGKEFAIGQGYGGHAIAANEQEVRSYALPCKPGDKIEASAYAVCANVSRVNAEVYFWDKNGSSIVPQEIAPFITDFSAFSNSAGGIAAMIRPGGFTVAPANAAYATLDVIAFTSGAGPASLTIQAPMLRIAQAGATELAAATPGVGVPNADQTSTNVASAIAGQGALATASSVSLTSQVTGSLPAGSVTYAGGITVQNLQPGQAGADVTSLNTAASLAGQGPLATTPTTVAAVLNANVALGSNLIVDSGMIRNGFAYGPGYSTTTVTPLRSANSGGYGNYIQAKLPGGAGSPAAAQVFDIFQTNPGQDQGLGYLLRYGAVVTPGDTVYASVHALYGHGATGVSVWVEWWDVNGAALPSSAIATGGFLADPNFYGLNGDIDGWFTRVGGFVTVPISARFATILARVNVPAGCTGDCQAAAARPFLAKVAAGQTAAPPYQVGATDRTADQTGSNVASAISGQGALATLSSVNLGTQTTGSVSLSSQVSGALPAGSVSYTNGQTAQLLQPATVAADKTANAVSASVAGQGALATATQTVAQVLNSNVQTSAGNAVVDSEFRQGLTCFGPGYDSLGGTGGSIQRNYAYGIQPYAYAYTSQASSTGGVFDVLHTLPGNSANNLQRYALQVNAGDRIYGSAMCSFTSGATNMEVHAVFWSYNGTIVGEVVLGTGGVANDQYAGNGDLQGHYSRVGGFYTVGSGAWYVTLLVRVDIPANAGGQGYCGQVMLTKVSSDQVSPPNYVPGPPDRAADQTAVNIASAVSGQSALAANTSLTPTQVANANVATSGGNQILDSDFLYPAANFGTGYDSFSGGFVRQNLNSYYNVAQVYAPSGKSLTAGGYVDVFSTLLNNDTSSTHVNKHAVQVNGGETYYASAMCAYANGASSCQVIVYGIDPFGNLVWSAVAGSGGTGNDPYSSNGDIQGHYSRVGGFVTIPGGVFHAFMVVRVIVPAGCTGNVSSFAAQPFMAKVSPGQTSAPPYSSGPSSRLANETGANVAASITGQSALATSSTVNLATQTAGSLPTGQVQYPNGQTVSALQPAQSGADITSSHTASGISGQGALATQSFADWYNGLTNVPAVFRDLMSGVINGGPAIKADYLFNQYNGQSITNYWPRQAGADVTSANVAGAISGQGALATQSRLTGGSQAPYSMSTATGAVYSPPYPLSSPGVGQISVAQGSVTLTNGTKYSWNSQTFSNVGGETWVFYNLSTGACDLQPPPATDAMVNNAYNYIPIGLQAPMTSTSGGSGGAPTYSPPTYTPPSGGGGGIGGGPRYGGNTGAQVP